MKPLFTRFKLLEGRNLMVFRNVVLLTAIMIVVQGCTSEPLFKDNKLILLIITVIYEVTVRLVPTRSKWYSIIEIIYGVITKLIPNRTSSKPNRD